MKNYYLSNKSSSNNSKHNKLIKALILFANNNPEITSNYKDHLNKINNNDDLRNEFDTFRKYISKSYSEFNSSRGRTNNDKFILNIKSNKQRLLKIDEKVNDKMNGGQLPLSVSLAILSFSSVGLLVLAIGAYLISQNKANFQYVMRMCHPTYPIVSTQSLIRPIDVLHAINPQLAQPHIQNLIHTINDQVNGYISYVMTALELGLSAGAIVASGGMGGDVIVKLIFTIFDSIQFASFLINSILSLNNPILMQFLMDILNVDFREGPYGVECWVNYLLNYYSNRPEALRNLCNFYKRIRNKVMVFIGKLIGGLLPNVPRILIGEITKKMATMAQSDLYEFVKKQYAIVPPHVKMMIEKPEMLKHNIDMALYSANDFIVNLPNLLPQIVASIIKRSGSLSPIPMTGFVSSVAGNIAGQSLETISKITGLTNLEQLTKTPGGINQFFGKITRNSETIAILINKIFAFIFSILYILTICQKNLGM
jgi:hypothetical protein